MASPEAKIPPTFTRLEISREEAALGQLETAIELWFHEGNEASIHTLAVAARGVLGTLARERKVKAKTTEGFISSQSETFRNRIRNAQNFFKHGNYTGRSKNHVVYFPELAEVFMIDAIVMCSQLFGELTALMFCFVIRYTLSNPGELPDEAIKAVKLKSGKVEDFADRSRGDFLKEVLSRLQNVR